MKIKKIVIFLIAINALHANNIMELNEEFTKLETEKKNFQIKVKHFNKEIEKREESIKKMLEKNQAILAKTDKREKEIAQQQQSLDKLYNNLYNKRQKKILSFYSQMKPSVIADIFSKLVIEDIEQAIFIIENIPEKQAIGTMMKLENSVNSLLTQKILKRKENAKRK